MTTNSPHLSPTSDPLAPARPLDGPGFMRHRRVLVVDDLRSRSYHVWASLTGLADEQDVTTAESVDEALMLIARHPPDLVLVAVDLRDGEALRLCRRLKRRPERMSVLLYSDAVDPLLAGAAVVAGADGVVESRASSAQRAGIARRSMLGDPPLSPLLPDAFHEVANHIDEPDRPIAAMLLAGATPMRSLTRWASAPAPCDCVTRQSSLAWTLSSPLGSPPGRLPFGVDRVFAAGVRHPRPETADGPAWLWRSAGR
jgi:DNA-binding NarL/FixJ family response regulator